MQYEDVLLRNKNVVHSCMSLKQLVVAKVYCYLLIDKYIKDYELKYIMKLKTKTEIIVKHLKLSTSTST